MSNALAIVRSLIIYGLCLPLAIVLGYLLAMPMDWGSFMFVLLAVLLPLIPILLRWHHLLLIASWNLTAVLFFLPGRPTLWIVMSVVSLLLSLLQHILNRETKLLSVPSLTRPLVFLTLVVVVTAVLAGGIGLRSFGSEEYGGKRYILLVAAVIGYYAISCQRVPRGREVLYVSVFLLSGVFWVIGSLPTLLGHISPRFYFIFAIFPVENLRALFGGGESGVVRSAGLTPAGAALVWYGLARYGVRGVFSFSEPWHILPCRFRGGFQVNQPWRLGMVLMGLWFSLEGGFRSAAIFFAMMFLFHFFAEGLHRSRALPIAILAGILSAAVVLPMASKLPITIQRSLSFLPLDIDPMIRLAADSSTEWRVRMWHTVLPMVPQYLLVGKGYLINPGELAMETGPMRHSSAEAAILAGDYHNGPLTLLIPLGIWGVIGFLWFLGASWRVLYRNYRYGDPELRRVNTFLFMYFLVHVFFFFFIFGSFYTEFFIFTGHVALSVSINGGVRGPAPVVTTKPTFNQFRLAPGRAMTSAGPHHGSNPV